MKSKRTNSKRFLLFYILLTYVLAFLFWWSYLLLDKINEYYTQTIELDKRQYEDKHGSLESYFESESYLNIQNKLSRQRLMIYTEGLVFFAILIFGFVKVRNSFIQEIELSQRQKNFILSITHELKSPLSSIRLFSETMKKRSLTQDQEQKLIKGTLEEVNRLEGLVDNLLLSAKIENDAYGFIRETFNLTQLVKKIVERCQHAHKIVVHSDIEEQVFIVADQSAITSMLVNLIENSIKYSTSKPNINVSLKKEQGSIRVEVKDQGVGIPDTEKRKIFNKFYRVGNEDTRSTKGTGLGLYIVNELARFHDAKIVVSDNQPNGTVFTVIFAV